jgi:hypothetical protein
MHGREKQQSWLKSDDQLGKTNLKGVVHKTGKPEFRADLRPDEVIIGYGVGIGKILIYSRLIYGQTGPS